MSSQDYRRSQANARTLATIFRRQEEAERGSPLRAGGVGAGGIVVKGGSIRIENGGNIEVDGDATFGGDTTIGGNARITGTLSLPAGIIDNDALASPLSFSAASADRDGFAILKAVTTVASVTIVVPPGFTTAVIQGLGTVFGFNQTATLDYLYARVYIDWPGGSAYGRLLLTPLTPNNGSGALAVNKQAQLAGLQAGQEVTVRMVVNSSFANLPAAPLNGASIDVTAVWAR